MKKRFFKKLFLSTLLVCTAALCALFCGCFFAGGDYDSPRSGKSDKTIGSFDDEFVTPSVG